MTPTPFRLDRNRTGLLVIDVQERLCAAMPEAELPRILQRTRAAIEGAKALGVPIVATEQYPKGLGPTVASLRPLLDAPIEKVEFSCASPDVLGRFEGKTHILVAGMETHVCVFQTVRDLAERGFTPVVLADAVLSRTATDRQVGLDLCRQAGAMIATVETALFDLLGRAGTPEFKAVSAAVK
jgi:nicotinamidase-related amidase